MGKIISTILIILVILLAVNQRRQIQAAKAELLSLKSAVAEVERLKAENEKLQAANPNPAEMDQLRQEVKDLGKLRNEVGQLRQQLKVPPAPLPVAGSATAPAQKPPLITWQQLAPVGRDTPQNAFMTFLWSLMQTNPDAMLSGLHPAATRTYGRRTPEQFKEIFLQEFGDPNGYRIVAVKESPEQPGTQMLGIELANGKEAVVGMVQTNGQWLIR